jgi:hypothetical protein
MFAACVLPQAKADAALLLEEPFGRLGHFAPTGHVAVYLSDVCAESPTRLRLCEPGEEGVVISRYRDVAGYDWLAVPLIPYLYAVEETRQIPESANAEEIALLRDEYRRAHLQSIAADASDGIAPAEEWTELVGSAYDRTIYGFLVPTTRAQDEALIARLNDSVNRKRFNVLSHNCADFARTILNFYYPHAVHRSWLIDAGISTPKQDARSLVKYGRHHEVTVSSFIIPQVSGSIPRSKTVDGVLDGFLKSKKYVLPLAILHPVITVAMVATYVTEGRFNPKKDAVTVDMAHTTQPVSVAALAQARFAVHSAGMAP